MTGLASLPRVPFVAAPTPLQPAPLLSAAIGAEVWFKRDDLTGLGLGGNKTRGLEYLLGDALARDCDCLVTGAGAQSNWAMLAGLAARRCGLDPYLVFYGSPVAPSGNLVLDELLGADVQYTGDPDRASVDDVILERADGLRAAGRRPYVVPRGGATALGVAGYVAASEELAEQLTAIDLRPSQLWLATGSCGTQAGLAAGLAGGAGSVQAGYDVVGVTVSRTVDECVDRIETFRDDVIDLLGLAAPTPAEVTVRAGYLGPGYGLPSPEGATAAQLVARTEGVFLDPVFGAKAMAGLLDAAAAGELAGPIVFLVSGGAATLFAGTRVTA